MDKVKQAQYSSRKSDAFCLTLTISESDKKVYAL